MTYTVAPDGTVQRVKSTKEVAAIAQSYVDYVKDAGSSK